MPATPFGEIGRLGTPRSAGRPLMPDGVGKGLEAVTSCCLARFGCRALTDGVTDGSWTDGGRGYVKGLCRRLQAPKGLNGGSVRIWPRCCLAP